jgi:hypothetical protein
MRRFLEVEDKLPEAKALDTDWAAVRARLRERLPSLYELEPGGPLMMDLGEEGWLLEVTPDRRLLCQMGMDLEDIKSLMSDGTPEDLGTDEVAKQVKYYIQPAVAKFRQILRGAGFEETTEMNDDYVAAIFHKDVDFTKPEEIEQAIQWCRKQFGV